MSDETEANVHAFLARVDSRAEAGDAASVKLRAALRIAEAAAIAGMRRLARNSPLAGLGIKPPTR